MIAPATAASTSMKPAADDPVQPLILLAQLRLCVAEQVLLQSVFNLELLFQCPDLVRRCFKQRVGGSAGSLELLCLFYQTVPATR